MNSQQCALMKVPAFGALVVLLVFGVCPTASAQSGWEPRQSNTTNALTAIDYWPTNPTKIITVGSNYVIRHSSDGGMTWHEGFDPRYIFDVAFTDTGASAVGIAVGAQGRILRSANGGASWSTRTSPTARRLHDVDFPTSTIGYAVGELGTVIKTTDGGLTWMSGGVVSPFTFNGVSFAGADTGTVVGENGAIFHTTNGGGTWIAQNSGTPNQLNGVDHWPPDPEHLTAVGDDGVILQTTNGGLTWVGSGTPDPAELSRVTFFDNNRGAIAGDGGKIFLTTNGGNTWVPQTTGVFTSLHGVAYYPPEPNDITAVGADGMILRTTNGGATWGQQTSYTNNVLRCIAVTRTIRIAAGAANVFRRSTNNGTSWLSVSGGDILYGVCTVPGTQEAWAVGRGSTIFYSSDGGINWTLKYGPSSDDFYAVQFLDSQHGFLTSSSLGRVYRTTDGGESWTNTAQTGMVRVYDIAFSDTATGHAVGASGLDGRISFTTNAGANWTGQAPTLIPYLRGISHDPANPDQRTVVGDSGTILHTTNLGTMWTPRSSGTTRDLEGVAYASGFHVYAVGGLGTIVRSTDSGATWTQQSSGVTNTLYDAAFISADTGYAVGTNGLILGTRTGGVVSVQDPHPASQIPNRCVLEQNYPNPFNSGTTFSLSILHPSVISLKIFDVLGHDITTLVNETKPPGEYSIQWEAAAMPSGIYFYRLWAFPLEGGTSYAQTKKLVLLK